MGVKDKKNKIRPPTLGRILKNLDENLKLNFLWPNCPNDSQYNFFYTFNTLPRYVKPECTTTQKLALVAGGGRKGYVESKTKF